jgi:hypothetical protein
VGKYGKAVAAALLAVATAFHTMLSDNVVTQQEGVQIAIAAVTALSVWLVPMLTYPWMKTAIAAVLAGLNVLVTAIVGGIGTGDLVQVSMSVFTVLVVGAAPAHSDRPAPAGPAGPSVERHD